MPRKAGAASERKAALEDKLMHNMIELQRVHTNLAEKFDSLSKQISALLMLFENTARTFASNPINQMSDKDREFLDKVDKLLEQNKTIAKGLTMMEEKIRSTAASRSQDAAEEQQPASFQVNTRPLPKF